MKNSWNRGGEQSHEVTRTMPSSTRKESSESAVCSAVFSEEKCKQLTSPSTAKQDDNVNKSCTRLPWRIRLAYSVGHVLNDLCASMWFSYLLTFMEYVLQFDASVSGSLLLLGQVADAIATPVIGIESDKTRDCCLCRYGKRKSWHLIGTVCVIFTFPFIFTSCISCSDAEPWIQFFYYGAFIVVFQFGWAAIQVAHVTLITDLTPNSDERVELNAYRHACTVASNICVYSIMWLALGLTTNDSSSKERLGPGDLPAFRNIMLCVIAIGSLFSLIFHVFVPERENTEQKIAEHKLAASKKKSEKLQPPTEAYRLRSCSTDIPLSLVTEMFTKPPTPSPYLSSSRKSVISTISRSSIDETPKPPKDAATPCQYCNGVTEAKPEEKSLVWKDWLKKSKFYQIGAIYMACRLFFNLSQIYTPIYLQKTLFLPKESIAIIPLITYISGFVFSFIMRPMANLTGAKFILLLGCLTGIGACIWVNFGQDDSYRTHQIYAVALVFGATTTMLVIASLALTADMIGDNTMSGAFVFGAMSFFDKLANGIVAFLVQLFTPERSADSLQETQPYFRYVIVYICGGSLILVLIFWLTLLRSSLGARHPKNVV